MPCFVGCGKKTASYNGFAAVFQHRTVFPIKFLRIIRLIWKICCLLYERTIGLKKIRHTVIALIYDSLHKLYDTQKHFFIQKNLVSEGISTSKAALFKYIRLAVRAVQKCCKLSIPWGLSTLSYIPWYVHLSLLQKHMRSTVHLHLKVPRITAGFPRDVHLTLNSHVLPEKTPLLKAVVL